MIKRIVSHPAWRVAIVVLLAANAALVAGRWLSDGLSGVGQSPPIAEATPTLSPEPVVVKQLVPSPAPAIQASLWWDSEMANRDLYIVDALYFRWVKQIFAWREIEVKKGEFVWQQADQVVSAAEGYKKFLIARLDVEPIWTHAERYGDDVLSGPPDNPQDFGDFCYTISSRYQGRSIKAYQIWNEPNLAREWGGKPPDPVAYVALLAACSEGIRRGDPNAIIISAGLAPTGTGLPVAMPDTDFLRGMYAAGAAEYFDMLGTNAPGYAAPPWASPDEVAGRPEWGGQRWASFRHVEDIRQIMVESGDGEKQVAVTEMGWTLDEIHPEYSWFAVTANQQAEYLAGAFWWARENWQPWIGLMTVIYLADPEWTEQDEEYWWAINVPSEGEPAVRPAYRTLRGLPDWMGDFYDTWGR